MPTDSPAPRAPSEWATDAAEIDRRACEIAHRALDGRYNQLGLSCEILALVRDAIDDAARAAAEATKAAMVEHVGESANKLRDRAAKLGDRGAIFAARANTWYAVERALSELPVPPVPSRPEAQKGEVGRAADIIRSNERHQRLRARAEGLAKIGSAAVPAPRSDGTDE